MIYLPSMVETYELIFYIKSDIVRSYFRLTFLDGTGVCCGDELVLTEPEREPILSDTEWNAYTATYPVNYGVAWCASGYTFASKSPRSICTGGHQIKDGRPMYTAEAPSALEIRLNSGDRTISRDEIQKAVALVEAGRVQPREGTDFKRLPDDFFKPRKKVRLTKAQREYLSLINEGKRPVYGQGRTHTRNILVDRGFLAYENGVWVVTDAGRDALRSVQS